MEQELVLSKSLDKNEAVIMQNIDENEIFPPEKTNNVFCTSKIEGNKKTKKGLIKMRSLDFAKESPIHGKSLPHARSFSSHFLINIDEIMSGDDNEKGALISNTSSGNMGIFPYDQSSITLQSISDDETLENTRKKNNILEVKTSCPMDQEDEDSCSWRRIQIETTLRIRLKFQDVKYTVALKGEKHSDAEKCILQGVSGSACPGEVLALMGPSGGGKTTLLKLLSGKVKNDSGMITYNDQPYNKSLKQRIGFVMQDDVVFPHLTVKETLIYAALLRLPNTLSKEQKKERAINVINELGLERCQDTIIGGTFVRGISGGERKRVCIGNEILLNPSLLFLDEPTSGLDSTTALRIVQMLHNIARAGKTVVTTIHQPSSRLFSRFDRLILLGQGCSLYSGKASEAMLYFSTIGCSPLIAMNPAEFLIDLANGNIKDKSIPSDLENKFLPGNHHFKSKNEGPSSADVHEYFVGAYESRFANEEKIKLLNHRLIEEDSEVQSLPNLRDSGATWNQQFSILFTRGIKERSHEYFSSLRIIQVIATAIIVGLLWWHSDTSSPKKMADQAGLLFFISVFWAFFPLFTAIFTFPQERAMLVKERSVNMYKLSAYFIARVTTDLLLDLVLPVIFLVIVYFMVGLKLTFPAFSLTLVTVLLSIIAAQGLGLAIGAAFMDVKKATTFASVTLMTFMLSGGFFVKEVPRFISWVRYISINYHTYRLLLKIQYNSLGCSTYGSVVPESGGVEVGAMLVMIIGYRLLAYFLLKKMKLRTTT
uniref:ABC transporter G family member 22-like isoform X1 n=2 Tax=Nicotiana TaxID=4085 RepID=A0A1S3XK58_TOBAC|nr:PREDICTED: ABC transporter G family member 22-like isoform X1 [Nicotiana sylvestris]XP_009799081.1 PREDICTED: ABC transporter G family member 22-like isoform X1 [Nicotiana sylvestris]XP_016440365.1 PREDICTED: ABC transporter G family member 22-like isoform X1 [Nicotiana tabacum]XP_016440366.1 PREDICTED: ABC transporter G family member 22-like isoform X1 [Nicotiana tabacum]